MKPAAPLLWAVLTIQVLLGTWFLYSGGVKLWVTGLDRFTRDIENYRLLSEPMSVWAAYSVPWLEVMAGACLMLGFWRRGAIIVLFGLVLGFGVFIGWAWVHQLDISCGCLGSDEPIHYWGKGVELTLYMLMLAGLWWAESRRPEKAEQKMQNMA